MKKKMVACCIGVLLLLTTVSFGAGNNYTLEQAMSDNAQLSTIAYSGLAFITGSEGGDTFMPPGKVADFFGFQYMRDVDIAGYGHNTTFLSKAANNILAILTDEQKAELVALAKEQAPIYVNFAYNRFPMMNAFRRSLEGDIPQGSDGLSIEAVSEYAARLYQLDAELSYNRSIVVGGIINDFTSQQKAYLAKMSFDDSSTWPEVAEDQTLKKNLTNTEFVAVMTYASEMFSWYKGSIDADIYFCPERHGTYFGGFYMKDYPAMNNPDYFISTAITGDSGKAFLAILNTSQRALITTIIDEQRAALEEIADIRAQVSEELRKSMSGGTVNKALVYNLIERYGALDGEMSALYAKRFSEVKETLTATQMTALVKLRNLSIVPEGAYLFSTPVDMPVIENTDYLFGVGTMPSDAGIGDAPDGFNASKDPNEPQRPTTEANPAKPTGQVQPQPQPQGTDTNPKPEGIRVEIDRKNVVFDTPPVIKQGRLLVPVRALVEALGATVVWEDNTQMITITKGSQIIRLEIGATGAIVGNVWKTLDVPASLSQSRALVPLRFIAEAMGLQVEWNAKAQMVIIR